MSGHGELKEAQLSQPKLAELSQRASTRKGKEALAALRDKYKKTDFNFTVRGVDYGEWLTNDNQPTSPATISGS